MTTCVVTGMACDCQPDEGIACTATLENVVKAMHGWRTACLKAEAELRAQSQPAPPVPADVQEIMRLIQPYVAACLKFNYTPMELIEQAEADVNEAFKPIEAALTALVEKNHELQFSLDGVNAMRRLPTPDQQDISGWWNSVKDSLAWSGAIVGLEWAELWPEAQDMLKVLVKATHGIKPEQGESHE